ncbi:MAG: hypothetical protein PHQ04_01460 [Opitutaceae bacterium]|nr:hypothetical protein [Opitutaceae bacterium]
MAGNLLAGPCGLVACGAVDLATGAGLAHKPNPVKVTLQPRQTTAPPDGLAPAAAPLNLAANL